MVRRICMAVAVLAGLGGALLLATPVTADVDGRSAGCGTVINSAAVTRVALADAPGLTPREVAEARRVDQACHGALVRTTALAGLAGLVCVACGTVITFRGRPGPLPTVRRPPALSLS